VRGPALSPRARALARSVLAASAILAATWTASGTGIGAAAGAGSSARDASNANATQVSAASTSPHWTLLTSIEPPFAVADQRFVDLDGRPGLEMCLVGQSGEVRVVRGEAGRRGLKPDLLGDLVLPDPAHIVIALARMSAGSGPSELVAASPRGIELFRADERGVLRGDPIPLLSRARFRLRVGMPTFADIVQDVNGDGRNDLVLPAGDKLELWIQQAAATSSGAPEKNPTAPTFLRAAAVHVPISNSRSTDAKELSDVLEADLSIPRLTMLDVNGDGRPDLCVKDGDVRSFHLVAADGSISERPDVSVDLSMFHDTTPEAEIKPGKTLAGAEKPHYEVRDLDADGIPDYVIAHRRKVWVFHGTRKGPQFTDPATILKADDDITGLLLADLDADKFPDLVLFKVQVPSLAAILRGLVQEWEVEIDAAGYKNLAGKTFDTKPAWKNALYLRLPSILSIVRDPEALIHRFEEVGRKFRLPTEADFDGDGKKDIALVTEDGATIEVWMGRERSPQTERESNEALLRKFVFDDPEHVWDLDRVLAFMGGYAERRTQLLTGDRPSDGRFPVRDSSLYDLSGVYAADVDGDGRSEIVVRYVSRAEGTVTYDVWGIQ
jgi:FG-GAP-like repeat